MTRPNLRQTLKCLARLVLREIRKNRAEGNTTTHALLEQPLGEQRGAEPTETEVFSLLDLLFEMISLSADSAVIMLIYVHRILVRTGIAMQASNWQRILLGGLVMATKVWGGARARSGRRAPRRQVWDDMAVWNVDFASILPGIDVQELNLLERFYLTAMEFKVNVKTSS